jgi:hypothetical protein
MSKSGHSDAGSASGIVPTRVVRDNVVPDSVANRPRACA